MPGRVTTARSSTTTRKTTEKPTRAASATPTANIPEEAPAPTASPNLRRDVCALFADAQRSTTGHRKLIVRLRKLQEISCGIRVKQTQTQTQTQTQSDHDDDDKKKKEEEEEGKGKGKKQFTVPDDETEAEKEFNVEIGRCMLRVLPVKKSEPVGDRIVRFLGGFLIHASEKDGEVFGSGQDGEENEDDDDDDDDEGLLETPTARLSASLANLFVPLLGAKDRTVRFRATQIVTHIVNSLESIDDELYHTIRQGLLKRIRDKEASIRVQAVMGLGRLAGNDDEEDANDESTTALLERLLDIMQNDTSADVRKTLLTNLPVTAATLKYLLERARDLDAATRRSLYSRLLPTLGDFRHLSLSMREKLLRWGLRDRDESVRKATGKLFCDRWIEDCAASNRPPEAAEEVPAGQRLPPNISALLELLERIDVVTSGNEGGIAHEAMRSLWEGRPDYRDAVVFDEPFWESLTAESAFLVRSFNDFCRVENEGILDALVDEKMPEVTALAYYLQKYAADLLRRKQAAKERGNVNDEDTVEHEFVVEQLLHIAITLDYSDEVGRRKMFSLLREFLAVPELPGECTKLAVETLRYVCGPSSAGENEFCSIILEAIAEVHDTLTPDESFASAKSEISDESSSRHRSETPASEDEPFNKEEAKAKLVREIVVNMKCLHLAQCMLQHVEGHLQQNVNLVTMLNNLVVPAVRSHEAPIRERGLECLGLCCLLDKSLAEENMTLFIHCYSKGHEGLQVTALHILCDLVSTHPSLLAPVVQSDGETVTAPAFQKPLFKAFARALKSSSPESVQTAAATALSKLLLMNALSPSGHNIPSAIQEFNQTAIEALLQSLIVSFFHPRTRQNPALRQALAYFFPVYCHSKIENTRVMQRVSVPVVRAVLNAAEEHYSLEAEEDSDGDIDETAAERELKTLVTGLVGMLAEWTDERRVVGLGGERVLAGGPASSNACGFVHLALIKDILERVLGISAGPNRCTKEEKKILFSLMSKLYVAAPQQPPPQTSRSGSRPPETTDPFRPSSRSGNSEQSFSIKPEDAQLVEEVKDLLDQTMEDGHAADAAGRNALVKVKNSVLKLLAASQGVKNLPVNLRDREGTEEPETDTMSVRSENVSVSGSRRGSEEPSTLLSTGKRGVAVEPSIAEEEEEEEGEETEVGTEREDHDAPRGSGIAVVIKKEARD